MPHDGQLPLALLAGPRRRIVNLLRLRDRTILELAAELAVSANAVRGHLAALGRDGLVSVGESRRRDQPGKPPATYGLTVAAEELFPRGYGGLLLDVLDLLCEWDGPDAAVEVMRATGVRTRSAEGAEAAVRALAAMGADVTLADADDAITITASGCPLAARVVDRPELCGWMAALLAGACGGSAAESCDRSGGRPRCRFTLEASPSSGAP
jgi:predicted ArsR family transcriptional regulator